LPLKKSDRKKINKNYFSKNLSWQCKNFFNQNKKTTSPKK